LRQYDNYHALRGKRISVQEPGRRRRDHRTLRGPGPHRPAAFARPPAAASHHRGKRAGALR
jgi:hypothetical protein